MFCGEWLKVTGLDEGTSRAEWAYVCEEATLSFSSWSVSSHQASQVALVVKNPLPVQERDVGSRTCPSGSDGRESACNVGDLGSTPGSGRSLGGGNGTRSSILAWRIPWTEEPGGLQFLGLHRVGHDCINLARHGSEVRERSQGRGAGRSLDGTGTGTRLFWLLLCRFFHPLPHLFSAEDFPEPGLILWFLLCMFSVK